jgi:hypothetical protein
VLVEVEVFDVDVRDVLKLLDLFEGESGAGANLISDCIFEEV